MEEAAENGKELSHSAHGSGMNVKNVTYSKTRIFHYGAY
jgi:hypothetical protein